MIVERKFKREFWFNSALNGIPDMVIAATVGMISDAGLFGFFGVLIGLQAVYFAIWIKNTIWLWTRFKLLDRKRAARRVRDFLSEHKFPRPDSVVGSAEDYLSDVAANESIDVETRILAASELGALRYSAGTMRMQEYMRLSMAYDDAIEEFSRSFKAA